MNLVTVYQWESERIAVFNYVLNEPPKSLKCLGQFRTFSDFETCIKRLQKNYPKTSIGYQNYKSVKISEFNYELMFEVFYGYKYGEQLTIKFE